MWISAPRTSRVIAARDLHHHRSAERLTSLHRHLRARPDLAVGEVAEHGGVAVRHPGEGAPLARVEITEGDRAVVADRKIPVGDRVAVRVVGGVAEHFGDPGLELLGDDVLEPVGFGHVLGRRLRVATNGIRNTNNGIKWVVSHGAKFSPSE